MTFKQTAFKVTTGFLALTTVAVGAWVTASVGAGLIVGPKVRAKIAWLHKL